MEKPTEQSASAGGATTPAVQTTFPQEIIMPLTMRILVHTQEERDAYLVPGTNDVQLGVAMDMIDTFNAYNMEELLNVNGRNIDEVKKQFKEGYFHTLKSIFPDIGLNENTHQRRNTPSPHYFYPTFS